MLSNQRGAALCHLFDAKCIVRLTPGPSGSIQSRHAFLATDVQRVQIAKPVARRGWRCQRTIRALRKCSDGNIWTERRVQQGEDPGDLSTKRGMPVNNRRGGISHTRDRI